jgi:hypothetical protein
MVKVLGVIRNLRVHHAAVFAVSAGSPEEASSITCKVLTHSWIVSVVMTGRNRCSSGRGYIGCGNWRTEKGFDAFPS